MRTRCSSLTLVSVFEAATIHGVLPLVFLIRTHHALQALFLAFLINGESSTPKQQQQRLAQTYSANYVLQWRLKLSLSSLSLSLSLFLTVEGGIIVPEPLFLSQNSHTYARTLMRSANMHKAKEHFFLVRILDWLVR